jgi:hypothetical protein
LTSVNRKRSGGALAASTNYRWFMADLRLRAKRDVPFLGY